MQVGCCHERGTSERAPLPARRCSCDSGTGAAGTLRMNARSTTAGRELAAGMVFVLLIAAVGVALALRGWRSRIPDMDVVPDILSAHALLERGRIPDRGVVSGYTSYVPPGEAWMV